MRSVRWLEINILASSRRIGGVLWLVGVEVSDERQSNRWNRVGADSECVWSDGQLGVQCEYDACTPGTMCRPMHVHDSLSPSLYVSLSLSPYVSVSNGRNRILPFYTQWRRPGAEFGGDGKFFRGPKFLNEVFFGKKFRFSRQKILMTFFSIGQVFLIFTLSFQILRIFTV